MKQRPSPRLGFAALAAAAAALAACGGGGGDGTSSIPTPTSTPVVAIGTITGFGSVVVNGVHYDDSTARITVDEQSATHDDLKVGMVVEIDGESHSDGSGEAQTIDFTPCVLGPIAALNLVQNTMTVMGQTVVVEPGTVFGGVAVQDMSAFAIGDLVQASCFPDLANDRMLATRVDMMGDYTEGVSGVAVEGIVADLNTTEGTCTVGGQPVNFSTSGSGNRPSGFANGMYVQVKGKGMAGGVMSGERIRERARIRAQQGDSMDVEGVISGFNSVGNFTVGEQTVDASKAVFDKGSSTDLHNGARVEIDGKVNGGVLEASAIEIKH